MIFNPLTHKVFLESLSKEEAEEYVSFLEVKQLDYKFEVADHLDIIGINKDDEGMQTHSRLLQSEIDILEDKIKRITILIDIVKLRKGLK